MNISSVLIRVWTDKGENRAAADVQLTEIPHGFTVDIAAVNNAALTQIVLRWELPPPVHARVLGDHWERGYGDLEWRGVVPERVLPWYALIHDPETKVTQGLGVATGTACFASWRVDEAGMTLVLDVRNGGGGVSLGGRVLRAAAVQMLTSEPEESVFAFGQRFCRQLCAAPRLPKFPVYGGNDWYYAYGNNSQDSIWRDANLLRELSPNRKNDPFMVIDAGWFPTGGCDGGPYEESNANFPSMPGLAQAMKNINVRPGIWIRPLLTSESLPDWELTEKHPVRKRDKGTFLDPSIPDVLARVWEDINRLREWGYTLIKHDFTTYDLTGRWGNEMGDGRLTSGDWHFADRSRTTAEIITDLYQTIRHAAGDDVLLIGCNTVGHLGAGFFEIQRTGDDTSGREWERTRKMGINTLAFRMMQHNTFFAADADCVGLTDAVPWEKNRQWLDLLARSGTPLFVSADPRAVGPVQRAALTEAFARAATVQLPAEPLDWMDTTCPRRWHFPQSGNHEYDWIVPGDI